METSKSLLRTTFLSIGILGIQASGTAGVAQSLDVKHPSPLREGQNTAVIDSFGGDQFWCFTAGPGNFKVNFNRSGAQEGFAVGGKAAFAAVFAPATEGATISGKDVNGGAAYTGHCNKPTRVVCMVQKPSSPLVRQTINYTITVSGSEGSSNSGSSTNFDASGGSSGAVETGGSNGLTGAHGAASSTDRVAGVYDVMVNSYGVAKFTSDGNITTTSGASGKWSMFDDATRTYVISIDTGKWTLTFEPARGFVDNNGTLIFSMKKVVH
ncbi:MAG TPA: hypothetical protein V6C97_26250 [Oculatellaceae cyanobacterium]